LDYIGGGVDGYGVGVKATSLSDELEPLDDGILMDSFGGMDLRPNFFFLFLGKHKKG